LAPFLPAAFRQNILRKGFSGPAGVLGACSLQGMSLGKDRTIKNFEKYGLPHKVRLPCPYEIIFFPVILGFLETPYRTYAVEQKIGSMKHQTV
jgi:hypothetical protein